MSVPLFKKRFLSGNYVLASLLLTAIVLVWVSSNYKWGDGHWRNVIKDDGTGYYAYLPAAFIYGDLNFRYFDDLVEQGVVKENQIHDFRNHYKGNPINKFYAGTAVAQIPFFLLGHLASVLMDQPLTGYSAYYMIFFQIGTIFYLLVGLYFFNRFLKLYEIGNKIRALVLIATVFGTGIFHYTVSEPSMSHVFSFAFVCMFLFGTKQYFNLPKSRYALLAAISLGMIILIRPVNVIFLLSLPFIAGSFGTLKCGFSELLKNLFIGIIAILLVIAIPAIQLMIYYVQTGEFFVYSYRGEGFDFLHPHMIDILISYRKGFFVYTPLAFLSLFGGYFLWKKSRFEFFSLLLFLFLVTWVLSSWRQWYYGGSFSARVYIEYLPFFILLLGLLVDRLKKPGIRKLVISVVFILIVLCQFQTYQYRLAVIHWSEMTKEKYWEVFADPSFLFDIKDEE